MLASIRHRVQAAIKLLDLAAGEELTLASMHPLRPGPHVASSPTSWSTRLEIWVLRPQELQPRPKSRCTVPRRLVFGGVLPAGGIRAGRHGQGRAR